MNEEGNVSPSGLQGEFSDGVRKLDRPQSAVINIKSSKVKFAQEGQAKAPNRLRHRAAEDTPQINFLSSLDDIRRAYNPHNDVGFQERILKFARATFSEIEQQRTLKSHQRKNFEARHLASKKSSNRLAQNLAPKSFLENLKFKFKDNNPLDINDVYSIVYSALLANNLLHLYGSPLQARQKVVLNFFKKHPALLIDALNTVKDQNKVLDLEHLANLKFIYPTKQSSTSRQTPERTRNRSDNKYLSHNAGIRQPDSVSGNT